MSTSLLDSGNIFRSVYDPATESLTVSFAAGGGLASEATLLDVLANQTNGTQKTKILDSAGTNIILGQTTMSSSLPVAIASDQGALSVSQSGTWNIVDISGTISLPTGASTSALQTSGNSSLSSIDGKIPSNLTVTSTRLLVDGSGVTQPVSAASLPLPTGAATSALQTTGNSNLSSIDGKLNSLGQNTMANSMPVVIASDQSTIPVSGTVTANNASIGATGAAIPASATMVGGSDGTDLRAFSVSATGVLSVDGSAVTQPISGTITANAGTNLNTSALALESGGNLASIKTNTDNLNLTQGSATSGQKGNLVLGAVATSAPTLISGESRPLSMDTAGGLRVNNALQAQGATSTGNVQPIGGAVSSALSGLSNATWQAIQLTTLGGSIKADLTTIGNGGSSISLGAGATDVGTQRVAQAGKSKANTPARNDYTSTSVTTGAYVQLVASTTSTTTEIEIFDSSGQTLVLAIGAAASEVDQINIFPGGNGRVPLSIPSGSRVSIKALSGTANVGEIDINFYA